MSFGLINIPIRVYSASEDHVLEFDMLHKKDLSPIRYARICKLEQKEVPYADIVKGYEYAKDEYIIIDEEDFKNANPKKTRMIEIQYFISIDEVDSIYFDKPYFLEPDKKATKAFALFCEALRKSKKCALAMFVFHNKEHVGIVKPYEKVLLLQQLRYHTEIRTTQELVLPTAEKITAKELDIALQLIDHLSAPFQPEKYKDTYTEELMAIIEDKLKGKRPARKTKAPLPVTPATDLMNLLKESLQKDLQQKKKSSSALPARLQKRKKTTHKHR